MVSATYRSSIVESGFQEIDEGKVRVSNELGGNEQEHAKAVGDLSQTYARACISSSCAPMAMCPIQSVQANYTVFPFAEAHILTPPQQSAMGDEQSRADQSRADQTRADQSRADQDKEGASVHQQHVLLPVYTSRCLINLNSDIYILTAQ
eukprot:gene10934-3008_t